MDEMMEPEESGLEPIIYFNKNRNRSYDIFLFSGNLCGTQGCEDNSGEKGYYRWNTDLANGTSADSGRLLSVTDLQQEKTVWNLFI